MKKMISVILAISLLLTVTLPAGAETTAKPIPFSGWSQGEEGTYWSSWYSWSIDTRYPARYFGQAALCQTAEDLTAYLQAGETPPDGIEAYDKTFFAEKSLLLLEVFGPQLNDQWYVDTITQEGDVLNCSLVFDNSPMGPDAIYNRTLCVELTEKPTDIQTLRIAITYNGGNPIDPQSVDFYYEPAPVEPPVKPPLQYTLGDVNGDGSHSAVDALLVLKSAVGKMELTAAQLAAAKTANTDALGAADALCILQKAVGKIRYFPVECTPVSHEQLQQEQGRDTVYFRANAENGWFTTLCTTYEEYVSFLDSDKISYNTDDSDIITNKKESYLAMFPQAYFDEGNSLLLYHYHAASGSFTSRVKEVNFVKGVLDVVIASEYPNTHTCDWVPKLYVCKLLDFAQPINRLEVTVEDWNVKYFSADNIVKTKDKTETYVYEN